MYRSTLFALLTLIGASALACAPSKLQRVEDAHADAPWSITEDALVAQAPPTTSTDNPEGVEPSVTSHCYEGGQGTRCYTFVDGRLYRRDVILSAAADTSRSAYTTTAEGLSERHGAPAVDLVFTADEGAVCGIYTGDDPRPVDEEADVYGGLDDDAAQAAFASEGLCAQRRWLDGEKDVAAIIMSPAEGAYDVRVLEYTTDSALHEAHAANRQAQLDALEARVNAIKGEVDTMEEETEDTKKLSRYDVINTVQVHTEAIAACGPDGDLHIAWVVTPSGATRDAKVVGGSLADDPAVTDCALEHVRSMTFPATSTEMPITYPFKL